MDVSIKHSDFPVRYVSHYQRVEESSIAHGPISSKALASWRHVVPLVPCWRPTSLPFASVAKTAPSTAAWVEPHRGHGALYPRAMKGKGSGPRHPLGSQESARRRVRMGPEPQSSARLEIPWLVLKKKWKLKG